MKQPAKTPRSAKVILDDTQRFTNADANLRPVGTPVVVLSPIDTPAEQKSHHFLVTAETFPRLHKDFLALQEKLGGPPYTLVISDALPNYYITEVYNDIHLIRIRLSAVATVPYKDIMQNLGHEHGHIWRELHPDVAPFPFSQNIPKPIAKELEPDLIGVCLTHDKAAALAWNARGGHGTSTDYANKSTFKHYVIALKWEDCPIGAALPEQGSSPPTNKQTLLTPRAH